MKNNKECKVIQDLLPNYIENLTTPETNEVIERHLEECKECKIIFEKMKSDTENKVENNDVEINYAKKVKSNLKLLNIILVLIVIGILVFVGNIVRKYCILMKLSNLGAESQSYTNYKVSRITLSGMNYCGLDEIIVRDDVIKFVHKFQSNFNAVMYGDFKNNIGYSYSYEFDEEEPEFIEKTSTDMILKTKPIIFSNRFAEKELFLEYAMKGKIREEDFFGVECYSIEYKGQKDYFEKDTGLLRMSSYAGSIESYYYEYNCVNDYMIKLPDKITSEHN